MVDIQTDNIFKIGKVISTRDEYCGFRIKVRIYDALMPVPALSFATRFYEANAGIMVTASHNPAKYNGYKAYGPDGCQMTDEAADIVYAQKKDRCREK